MTGEQKRIWGIANTLRGKMNADKFCDYILGFILYKYLPERLYTSDGQANGDPSHG